MKAKLTFIAFALAVVSTLNAQVINPKETAKRKVEDRTNRKANETIDKGLDKIEKGIENIFKKKDKKEKDNNPQSGSTNNPDTDQSTAKNGNTDFSKYKNFDFIPGKNIIFFDNFSDGSTNKWKAYNPVLYSVVPLEGNNWLELRGTRFTPINLGLLPEEVTIEFDIYVKPVENDVYYGTLNIQFVDQSQKDRLEDPYFDNSSTISIDPTSEVKGLGRLDYDRNENGEMVLNIDEVGFKTWQPEFDSKPAHISIYRKGSKVTLYLNNEKLLNNVDLLSSKRKYGLTFNHQNYFVETAKQFITNVRIASGVPNATNEVKSQGKFVTNTIYFDVNSAHIKPESWMTLKQSAEAIKANPGNFLIVGHTDSDGADDTNLKLSQSRAAAVKNALVKEFEIDASRLNTDGKGEAQPITSNNTASAKEQNRRVEFIKQ